jgi:hypothetical protein
MGGRHYTDMPNAFAYRKAFNPNCSCKGIGQTWADALKHLDDQTVERGDIVVNEERARALSQPQTDAQGRPLRQNTQNTKAATPVAKGAAAAPPAPANGAAPDEKPPDGAKRPVRTIGPTFLPAQ